MATRKSEWLASIKPILDRDEVKKDAKELARELGDILEINIDANPENLKQLTDEFNKQLSKMGKQPIVFSEKTLQGIVNQFADAIASGFAKGADAGVAEALKRQLEGLKKQRQELIQEQDKVNRTVKARSRMERLESFEIETARPFKVDGDVGQEAKKLVDVLYQSADQIAQAEKQYGKASIKYRDAVLDAQETYNEFLRMQKTLKSMPTSERLSISKDVRASYDLLGKDRDAYEAAGGMNLPFDEDFAAEKILDAFEELSDIFENSIDRAIDFKKQLQQIDAQIDSITKQIQEVGVTDDSIFADAKDGLKTLQEIEAAYDRILKKRTTRGGHKPIDNVTDALEYTPGSETLATLRNRYNTSLSSGEDWEVQYQWLVKFVKEYEASLARINAEENKTDKKNLLATLKKYTELYNSVKPLAVEAEASLLEVAKKAGYQSDKRSGDVGSGDVVDARVSQKAREEADKEAEAEKRAEESLRQQRIEEEKIAKAKVKQRLEEERIAEAKHKAAEEAERERQATMSAGNVAEGNHATRKEVALSDITQDVGGKEKFAYLNTETGKISSYIEGEYEGVTKAAMKELLSAINETMNATIHSHPEDVAAPSEEDIQSFVDDIDGFKRNFILAGKQLAEIDFSELTREQAQMIADVYKANVIGSDDERASRLLNSPLKDLGVSSIDGDHVLSTISEQLKVRFPELLSDIDTYIEKLRALFDSTPITDLTQNELEEVISDEVEFDFKNSDRNQQSGIYEISKEIIDSATGVPAMYQQELQNIFKQTIEYLEFDASKIFKLYDIDDFQAQLDASRKRAMEGSSGSHEETKAHRDNATAINEEAQAQAKLNEAKAREPDSGSHVEIHGSGDASSAELEAAVTRTAALQSDLDYARQELADKTSEFTRTQAENEAKLRVEMEKRENLQRDLDTTGRQLADAQNKKLEAEELARRVIEESDVKDGIIQELREQLANVKTGASEGQASVGSEELKNVLSSITYSVKIVHDDVDKNANKIAIDESTLENTLKRVFVRELNPQIEQADPEPKNEPWALEKTLQTVKSVLDAIQTNTAKPESVEVAPAKTDIGNVLATENTLAAIKTAVEAINNKILGKISGVVKSESGKIVKTPAERKKHKDGTISHGQAEGSPHSMQKLFDYYYWIEEQIEQFKNNKLYVSALQNVQSEIAPKLIDYYDRLEKSGEEYPAWMAPLDEKHNLHMSKIRGEEAQSDSASIEKKTLDILKEEYKLRKEIFELKQKGATSDDVAPFQEMLGIYQSIRETLEFNMADDELLRYTTAATKEVNKGEHQLSIKQIIANIQARKAEDKATGAAYKELIELQKTRNELELKYAKAQEGSAAKQLYAEQLTQMDQAIAKRRVIIDNDEYELKLAKMQEAQARKLGEAEAKAADKDAKKQAANAKKMAQREAMLGKAGNAVGRAENTWMNAIGIEGELPADFTAKIDEYYQKLDALRKKHQELKNSDMISDEQKKELLAQTLEINKLTDEIGGLVSEYQKLSGDNVTVIGQDKLDSDAGLDAYKQQLTQAVMTATNGKAQIKNFDAATGTLTYTVKTGAHEFTEYTAAVRRAGGALVSVQGATKKTETFFEATARKMKELTSYFSGMAVFNFAKQEFKRGIQYIREIDLALTELKKVTNETEQTYDKFLDTAAKTADKVGSTIKEIVNSTADWARLNI